MLGRVVALVLLAGTAFGGERLSGYTYESQLLEPGRGEVQADLAYRFLRTTTYEEADVRTGFSHGLSKWLEGQLLLDFAIVTPAEGQGSALGLVTGLLRAKMTDGRSDAVGLGAEFSASVGPSVGALQLRGIADRWFGNLWLGFNASVSQAIGDDPVPTRLEQSLALAYQLPTKVALGFEARNRSGFDTHSHFIGDAVYLGPTLSARYHKVWTALSLLMQVGAFKAKAQQGNGEPNEVIDNERFNLRFALGLDLD